MERKYKFDNLFRKESEKKSWFLASKTKGNKLTKILTKIITKTKQKQKKKKKKKI